MAINKVSAPRLEFSNRTKRLDLSKSRQNKGISLEQIAESTKISIRFLRAIEDEEFDKLPGGIFSTSYLRQYAAAAGFDESRLLAHFRAKSGRDEEAERRTEPTRSSLFRWLRTPAAAGR
jgi:cytoskeletal protein RodZ